MSADVQVGAAVIGVGFEGADDEEANVDQMTDQTLAVPISPQLLRQMPGFH